MDVYSLFSLQFIGFFCLFVIAFIISFYLPGSLFFSPKRFSLGLHLFLSCMTGMVLWGVQGYVFGYLTLRFLTYVYLIVIMYFVYQRRQEYRDIWHDSFSSLRRHTFPALLVSLGVVLQLLPVFGSGVPYPEGVRFFGVNGADGIMHISFIRSIAAYFPPIEPGAVGNQITNYHYWSDLIIAELVRIWGLPITHTFFQYMPLFIAILTGLGAYLALRVLGFPVRAGVLAVFFFYFAGDAVFILSYLIHHTVSFQAPAIDNGITQFLNMPNAMARPVFLAMIIMLVYWLKERRRSEGLLLALLTASLVGIKVYYGMFAILGLCLIFAIEGGGYLIHNHKKTSALKLVKKTWREKQDFLFLLLITAGIAAAIYFPPNQHSGGLGWYPIEWPKLFLGQGALDWRDWWLRRQVYEAAGNIRNLLLLDTAAIVVTLVAVHGTRLIGIVPDKAVYKTLGWRMLVFFVPGLIIFHILGLFTLQRSGGFNVFNFLVVGTVVLSLMTAMLFSQWWQGGVMKKTLVIVLLLLTIPRAVYEVQHTIFLYTQPEFNSVLVTNGELEGLHFLAEHTDRQAVIQSHISNTVDQLYIPFFSGRYTFLTGIRLQETHNQPIAGRKKQLQHLFALTTYEEFYAEARKLHINYIYLRKIPAEKLPFTPSPRMLKTVFENDSVLIYQVMHG